MPTLDNPERFFRVVQKLLRGNRAPEACAAMKQFVERHPDDVRAQLKLGDLYARNGDPRATTAAYLAAFALAGGLTLITFDTGFRKYPDLDCQPWQ